MFFIRKDVFIIMVSVLEEKSTSQLGSEEIKQYMKDLKTGNNQARAIAAYMLGIIGKKDKTVRKLLLKALKDSDWEVRKWSALSLGEIGERDSLLVPILIEILKRDDSKEFRSHAAIILGELEKRSVPAIPVLSEATRDENTRVREWACWAIGKISGMKTSCEVDYPAERPSLSDKLRIVRE